jgi:dTDP-4-dehydrorhamnose 3,5-epimerase
MQVSSASLADVLVFEPEPFVDHRGFFIRTLSAQTLADVGIDHTRFVEESQSRSRRGVLRGLHGRAALSEGKLVRCARGEVFEVVVDLRPWSPSFERWESFVLDDRTHRQLWVPPGLVHGFQVLSEQADICYRMDAVHEPSLDITVAWDDPDLAIPWPLSDPILSERDRAAPRLAELRPSLERWFGRERPGAG